MITIGKKEMTVGNGKLIKIPEIDTYRVYGHRDKKDFALECKFKCTFLVLRSHRGLKDVLSNC